MSRSWIAYPRNPALFRRADGKLDRSEQRPDLGRPAELRDPSDVIGLKVFSAVPLCGMPGGWSGRPLVCPALT